MKSKIAKNIEGFGASIADIKQQVAISLVISPRVKLNDVGGRLKGLCPFHDEKSPSFVVNDSDGYYHCFGCGAHGDAFDFIKNFERVDLTEAIKIIAKENGIALTETVKRQEHEALYNVMAAVVNWCSSQLNRNSNGLKAIEYLKDRGITEESIALFRLGYCDADNFNDFAKLFSINDLRAVHLISAKDTKFIRPVFGGRIIFPVCDAKGRVVALAGRAINNITGAKYINSSESPIFKKGNIFYNSHLAMQAALKKDEIIVVEGYTDVIMMRQSGISNVVASMGTAVSAERLALLWDRVSTVNMCFDGDNAGLLAMSKLAFEIFPHLKSVEYNLNFTLLPAGLDPADTANSMPAAIDLSAMTIGVLSKEYGTKTPGELARLDAQLNHLASLIPNAVLRKYYRNCFREAMYRLSGPKYLAKKTNAETSFAEIRKNMADQVSRLEISCALSNPQILQGVEEDFLKVEPCDPELKAMKYFILDLFHKNSSLQKSELELEFKERFGSICGGYVCCDYTVISSIAKCWVELRLYDEELDRCSSRRGSLDDLLRYGDLTAKFKDVVQRLNELMSTIEL